MTKNEKPNAAKSKSTKSAKLSFKTSIKLLGTVIMNNEMLKAKLLATRKRAKG
jgi:hypothetical protein